MTPRDETSPVGQSDSRLEAERKRADEATAVALYFAGVLKDHENVSMPYGYGAEYFPFARALQRRREWLGRQPGGWVR